MNTNFVKLNDRVQAICTIYDLPPDTSIIHAEEGDLGTVVHTEPGIWPTIRFDKTGTATMVSDQEVKKI